MVLDLEVLERSLGGIQHGKELDIRRLQTHSWRGKSTIIVI